MLEESQLNSKHQYINEVKSSLSAFMTKLGNLFTTKKLGDLVLAQSI